MLAMEDDQGIVFLVENAQQFWSELEDTLNFQTNEPPTLSLLDSTLMKFLGLCAAYHEQYLQSPLQLEHACNLILDSELFEFHSERMCEIIVNDIQTRTDPHSLLIFYDVLLCYGRRRPENFRLQKRWEPLLPLLMDHVLVEIDPDVEDTYFGMAGGSTGNSVSVPVPIEAKLRSLSVTLLYEVCRVQKLSMQDLRIFDDAFIDYLFDLVEQTRHMQDETFNYSVIKLIVSLNEQFMVVSLPDGPTPKINETSESMNRVLRVLMRRLGSSKTFGENMIFMLNRAQRTPDDLCMQLLILKILYVLFTTKGTSEYFYTNDLCVLVDVFLRELADLDEESESLRHTYLRVLHPLLTKTQLGYVPYKRSQIVYLLESLLKNSNIREVNSTTKRLVERCLAGDWCVNFRKVHVAVKEGRGSPTSESSVMSPSHPEFSGTTSVQLARANSKTLKSSRSVENLKVRQRPPRPPRSLLDNVRRPDTIVPDQVPQTTTPKRKGAASSVRDRHHYHPHTESEFHHHHHQIIPPMAFTSSRAVLPVHPDAVSHTVSEGSSPVSPPHRRSAPPPPIKRRKPPAIPVAQTNGGATFQTIRTSATSPLAKVTTKSPNI